MLLFAALCMSEGAPIGFIWWALPTKLRAAGVELPEIATLTSLLVLPWALKVLWAPLVDILARRWSLRAWILSAQFLMGISLLPLFFLDLRADFLTLGAVLLLHALFAATQDVAIDALCIRSTQPQERGAINGWIQAGMLTSRSLLGGGTLILTEALGESAVVALLIAVVWGSSVLLLMSREEMPIGASGGVSRGPSLLGMMKNALRRRSTKAGLAFAVIAGAGYGAAGAVAGPFWSTAGSRLPRWVGSFLCRPSSA
jgi:PAT family beta-lactamase induction signal transducer AmpG